jgi:hypothetical protein
MSDQKTRIGNITFLLIKRQEQSDKPNNPFIEIEYTNGSETSEKLLFTDLIAKHRSSDKIIINCDNFDGGIVARLVNFYLSLNYSVIFSDTQGFEIHDLTVLELEKPKDKTI